MTQQHCQELDSYHQMHFSSLQGMDNILVFTVGTSDRTNT